MNYSKLFSLAKINNINQIEIYEEHIKETDIITFNNKLDKFENSNNKFINIKAIYNNKTVNIRLTADNYDENKIIDIIKINSKYTEKESTDRICNSQIECNINRNIEEININELIEKMINYNNIKEKYHNLKNINLSFSKIEKTIKIINSNNIYLEDYNNYYYFASEITILDNDRLSTNRQDQYSKYFNEIDMDKVVNESINNAIDKLNYKTPDNGEYKVLLKNECVAYILDTISSMFMADNIQNGKSLLSDKINQLVFSNKLTIVEDPSDENSCGKRLFDDEGTKTIYKEIISDGIFKTKLYDIKTAIEDGVNLTGNGYKNISYRNMYIKPSDKSYIDLLNKIDNGILIDNIEGMHAGINTINGNISLQAQGYIIKNGKKLDSIKLFTISTNIFEMFNNIDEIGNDLKFINIKCGSPSVLFDNLGISS